MSIKTGIFRGLTAFFAFLLVLSIATALVMEQYRSPLDENTGSISSQVVVDSEDGEWTYESDFKTAEEAFEGFKSFAIKEAVETFVLLKNENDALPLTGSKPKVTLLGIRSYGAIYGSNGGSDSHTLGEGAYRGQPYEDAEEYTGYGTRVAPSFLFAAVRICARADGFAQARFFRAGRVAGSPKVHSKNKST